ncbi:MAG: PLP-dependent cysteine synthase family protein [Gordonia sp. (in: high G+C Gram-positive bacteria)]|uniref:PLP-dependent cysteine synthase family protein n=1 Tax=Gordonia sp. (in: high G+C Gram-positive bacteria) TaxID=84139 RepID=UPI003BB5120B
METVDLNRYDPAQRAWTAAAVAKIKAEANRSADTHLIAVPLPEQWGIDLYLKDESTHPTGSLKHRLARSLFLHALCNGWIRQGSPVVEASSGSTAVSEAYFAALIGVPFIAVMAESTSRAKIELIEREGGQCHLVADPSTVYDVAQRIAAQRGGHYMDQFTFAERATDWRGNNNIAESIFAQLSMERYSDPEWIVATAGTGGTSATIARYLAYTGRATGVCVADPENSAFFPAWQAGDCQITTAVGSRIEGIGRQRVEPSFVGTGIDRMMVVPDAAAIATIWHLEDVLGRRVGGSTGTGLWAAYQIIAELIAQERTGSVVALLCDSGDRYTDKYYSEEWVVQAGLDLTPYAARLDGFFRTGRFA